MEKVRKYSNLQIADRLVRFGFSFLEKNFPGSTKKIDPRTVNIQSARECPFRQATGIDIYEYAREKGRTEKFFKLRGFWALTLLPASEINDAWKRGLA